MEHNIGPYRYNPCLESVPVTPIMDTQLDELTINSLLIPLGKRLLRLLKDKVLARKKEDWYEIFLASFVTLHNSEQVFGHALEFERRFGLGVSFRST